MALTNSQYNAIMREYNRRQSLSRHILEERTREVYAAVPEYQDYLTQISLLSVDAAKFALTGDNEALENLHANIETLHSKMKHALINVGFPHDYLEPVYTCNACKDTGYIDNKKCTCFKQATINLLYEQSNLTDILNSENFDTFSLKYYSNNSIDPITGLTPQDNAKKVLSICQEYVTNFPCGDNILFYGSTGVGKTFLSNCIAKALLDKAHSVLYMSAIDLYENLSNKSSDNYTGIETPALEEQIMSCDLLIIDDLGTELVNSYTSSKLFHCLNNRLQSNLSTVISTNFTLQELMATYSERIFSRISSSYKLLKLFGDDIRIIKK